MSRDVLDPIDPPPHPTPEDTMKDSEFTLTEDMLVQFRGCDPVNECYGECLQAAANAIKERYDPDEIRDATEWARQQQW